MKRPLASLASGLLAVLLSTAALLAPRGVAAQHGTGEEPGASPRNAIYAQAAPGIVRLESIRFG
ncbi:MAG TPA: hypothetical protein VFB73_00065 [Chloroflexota bacterium]|nr:hypothetical protein [Chloroflexota bacterium]